MAGEIPDPPGVRKLIDALIELSTFYHEAAGYHNINLDVSNLARPEFMLRSAQLSDIEAVFSYWNAMSELIETAEHVLHYVNQPDMINYYLASKSEGTLKAIELRRNEATDLLERLVEWRRTYQFQAFTAAHVPKDGGVKTAKELYKKYPRADDFYIYILGRLRDMAEEEKSEIEEAIAETGRAILDVKEADEPVEPRKKPYIMDELPYMFGMRPNGGWSREVPQDGIIISRDGYGGFDYDLRGLLRPLDLSSGLNAHITSQTQTIKPIVAEKDDRGLAPGGMVYEKYGNLYRTLHTEYAPRTHRVEEKYNELVGEEIARWKLPAIVVPDPEWVEKLSRTRKEKMNKWLREEFTRVKLPKRVEQLFDVMVAAPVVENLVSRDLQERYKGATERESYMVSGLLRARALRTEYLKCLEGAFRMYGAGLTGAMDFGGDPKRIKQYYELICEDVIKRLSANKFYEDADKSLKQLALEQYVYNVNPEDHEE